MIFKIIIILHVRSSTKIDVFSALKDNVMLDANEALQCHYCILKYFLEAERREQEKVWHNSVWD